MKRVANLRRKVAFGIFCFIATIFLVASLGLFFTPVIPGHLLEFLGKPQQELEGRVTSILLMLLRVIGVLYFTLGMTLLSLALGPFRRNEKGVLLTLSCLLLPFVFISVFTLPIGTIRSNIVFPPFIFVLSGTGLLLARKS